jgi:hypothetical protein
MITSLKFPQRLIAVLPLVALLLIGMQSRHAPNAPVFQSSAVDLALVLDGSGSLSTADFALAQAFARQLSAACVSGADTRIAIIQFSDEGRARTQIVLSRDADAINAAIDNATQPGGLSDIQEGLHVAQAALAQSRANARKRIILLTDGAQTEPGDPVVQAKEIKNAGIDIFAVGVGLASSEQLRAIASDPDSTYVFEAPDFRSIADIAAQLTQNACGVAPAQPHGAQQAATHISVIQRASPNTTVATGGIVTYTIEIVNRGEDDAANMRVTVPLNPRHARLLDVTFNRPDAAISTVQRDSLELAIGELDDGESVGATLRVQIAGTVEGNTALGERLTFVWQDDGEVRSGVSNLPALIAGAGDTSTDLYPISASPISGRAGETHTFRSDIFAPGEPVSLWYNKPDGTAEGVGVVPANDEGAISVEFTTDGLAPGFYSMVAHGNWTAFSGLAAFQVE